MKTNLEKFNSYNLRVKKAAKTKISILNTFLLLLQKKSMEEIKVQEICEIVEISQKTFFNYFEKKEQLLSYFIQLHACEMGFIGSKLLNQTKNPLDAIREIFLKTAKDIVQMPQIMVEIICLQSKSEMVCEFEVTDAEKFLFFPDIAEIDSYKDGGLDILIPALLQEAKSAKLLYEDTDIAALYLHLMSTFYGSSILALKHDPEQYPHILGAMITQTLHIHTKGKNNDRKK